MGDDVGETGSGSEEAAYGEWGGAGRLSPSPPRCASGPRAVEEGLLAEVEAAAAASEGDLRILARPARIVVPSQSLREHLCAALVRRAGRARLGVRVQTLDGLALEVLEGTGEAVASSLPYAAAVREAARAEPALARELGSLRDGYAAVVASVDDLLDAGFTPAHAESVGERLAALPEVRGAALARAAAVLRVAAVVATELASGAFGHRSVRLARVAALLAEQPARLAARALWIHGFADATGVQADLLEVLVRRRGARVWLDLPSGPSVAAGLLEAGFGARLRERLGGSVALAPRGEAPPVRLSASRPSDPEAECRAAARWARRRLDAGAFPERLALVARDLGRYRWGLRRQLSRHGVPFSGLEERGAAGPVARRLAALGDLLDEGEGLAAERWLEAVERVRGQTQDGVGWQVPSDAERADLLHALHEQGIATLEDLRARRRESARRPRAAALPDPWRRAAYTVSGWLERAPQRAPLARHAVALRALALRVLGWDPHGDTVTALDALLAPCAEAGSRSVEREDFARLLSLAGAGRDALGGRGGGVRVLSVMEARARCFDALWLLGMSRGVFPRRPSEDPLLPDALRRPLRDVLPDLPLKGAAGEERFLFAQLVASAPEIHLSSARHDERGRPAPVSPLLDRLEAPAVPEAAAEEPVDLHDRLLSTALAGTREDFARLLPVALAHGRRMLGLADHDAAALARARLALLRELEPRGARRSALGPYLGAVGEARRAADPRRLPPYVTQLENVARCPWQAFLTRLLRLAAPPDAHGPLPAAADARLLGNAVHAALERLASSDARWPEEPAPEVLLRQSAERVLRRERVALPGYARALARRTAPYVEVARRLAVEDPAERLAAEGEGETRVRDLAGKERPLRFKPDLVERDASGRLRLTDYKTGRPPGRGELGRSVAAGKLLQAQAYARAAPGASGRFVYLAPELADASRVLVAEADGPEGAAFEASVAVLLEALDRGMLPPRLRRPDRDEEPDACRSCEVKLACLRGDSGSRLRLGAWADAAAAATPGERAALALWRLAEKAR